jgi:hypothetical protein
VNVPGSNAPPRGFRGYDTVSGEAHVLVVHAKVGVNRQL